MAWEPMEGEDCPQSTELTRVAWLYCSPIPVGRRGVISLFKWFLPAFPRVEEGGGVGILWGSLEQGQGEKFFLPKSRTHVYFVTEAHLFAFRAQVDSEGSL